MSSCRRRTRGSSGPSHAGGRGVKQGRTTPLPLLLNAVECVEKSDNVKSSCPFRAFSVIAKLRRHQYHGEQRRVSRVRNAIITITLVLGSDSMAL